MSEKNKFTIQVTDLLDILEKSLALASASSSSFFLLEVFLFLINTSAFELFLLKLVLYLLLLSFVDVFGVVYPFIRPGH